MYDDEKSGYASSTLHDTLDDAHLPPPTIGVRRFSNGSLPDAADGPRGQLRVINPDLSHSNSHVLTEK